HQLAGLLLARAFVVVLQPGPEDGAQLADAHVGPEQRADLGDRLPQLVFQRAQGVDAEGQGVVLPLDLEGDFAPQLVRHVSASAISPWDQARATDEATFMVSSADIASPSGAVGT